MSAQQTAAPGRAAPAESHARAWHGSGWGFLAKLAVMALVNALGVAIAWAAYVQAAWGILAASVALLLVADVVYFSRRTLPLKYLLPGLGFLLVFQLFTMAYTAYVALTNYGTGHNVSQEQAVDALLIQDERPVAGATPTP